MDQHDVNVLVVGGGPAGLITTLLLAQQGVQVQFVTEHPGVGCLCSVSEPQRAAGSAARNGTADSAPALAGRYRPTAQPGPGRHTCGSPAQAAAPPSTSSVFALLTGPAAGVWHTASALVTQTSRPFAGNCGGWRPYAAVRKVPLSVTTIAAPEFASAYELGSQYRRMAVALLTMMILAISVIMGISPFQRIAPTGELPQPSGNPQPAPVSNR
jgi:hypothetical protein